MASIPTEQDPNPNPDLESQETTPLITLPTNWPSNIEYLTTHRYTSQVTSDQRTALSRITPESSLYTRIPATLLPQPYPWLSILPITTPSHPAFNQRGLFAAQPLPPDSFICLYLGLVHNNSLSDTDPHSDYDLSLDRDIGLSVDAARMGNESRCANDYRGIAERPNAEFRDCLVGVASERRAGGKKWERRVGIFVLSAGKAGKRKAGIREGEEVVVNYGKGFWEARRLLAGFRGDEVMKEAARRALEE